MKQEDGDGKYESKGAGELSNLGSKLSKQFVVAESML